MDVDVFPLAEVDIKVEDVAINFDSDEEKQGYHENGEDSDPGSPMATSDGTETPVDAGEPELEMKTRFSDILNKMLQKKADNSGILSKDKYRTLLEDVKQAKSKQKRKSIDYRRLKKYDIIKINGKEKLIVPATGNKNGVLYYTHAEELFDVLHKAHLKIGHGGRTKMEKELQNKYKNVTKEVITLYLSLCQPCQAKLSYPRKGLVSKPLIYQELNSRCQVDLIDMETNPDGEYKFVLNYQDHLTKFVLLHPLKSKRAEEVANRLVDIFTIISAPCVLQSDNGIQFTNEVIDEVKKIWPDVKLVNGKPSLGSANQDVRNMIMTWMQTHKSTHWVESLRFVQFMKNRTFHQGIRQSPFEAMFGCKAKMGLSTSNLPEEVINNLKTEEDLENVEMVNDTNSRTVSGSKLKPSESLVDNDKRFCVVCGRECNESSYQADGGRITCRLCFNPLLIVKEVPDKPRAQNKHKLQRKPGKVSQVRKYCKVCYDKNVTKFGRLMARKKTKRVVTFCNTCLGQPFLCLPCFNEIH